MKNNKVMDKVLQIESGDILINFTRLEYDENLNLVFVWYDNKIVANFDSRYFKITYDFKGTISLFFKAVKIDG